MIVIFHVIDMLFHVVVITGLLTVDPRSRLKITDLQKNLWLKGSCVSSTPLLSPKVLSPGPRLPTSFNVTMKAFHLATKQGFQLSAVTNAPLAKRRNQKRAPKRRTSSDAASSSSNSSLAMASSGTSSQSTCSTPTTPTVENSEVIRPFPSSPSANVEVLSSPSAKKPRLYSDEMFASSSNWDSVKTPQIVAFDDAIENLEETASTVTSGRSSDESSATVSRQLSLAESGYSTNTTCDASPPFLGVKPGPSNLHSRVEFINDAS